MPTEHNESLQKFQRLVQNTGNTYSFDGDTSIEGIRLLVQAVREMGLDPMVTEQLRSGILRMFRIELVNPPDFANSRYILAPNHVSDADAIFLGLLHPKIRIVSKDAWTNNKKLRQFLDLHYDVYGLDRASVSSLRALIKNALAYFAAQDGPKHYLVFSQGTISDFNHNSPERISPIAQSISAKTGVPVLPVFLEQVSLEHPTRIVFDEPLQVSRGEDFRTAWLERQFAMQQSLTPAARLPTLSEKHANNNRPGDPYF